MTSTDLRKLRWERKKTFMTRICIVISLGGLCLSKIRASSSSSRGRDMKRRSSLISKASSSIDRELRVSSSDRDAPGQETHSRASVTL